MTPQLADHFFRHEYGKLVSLLTRRVGSRRLEAIEDAVQAALLATVESWPRSGAPDNPSAWLYRVAHNHLVDGLRAHARHETLTAERCDAPRDAPQPSALLSGDFRDELLHLLFVCCDDAIPVEAQLVLALKTLCGFDVREIAERLFTSQANVYKRLARGRARLRDAGFDSSTSTNEQLAARLPAVHAILYTLFTEGYLSSHPEDAIRLELCAEALRLTTLLAEHELGATPRSFALLALMHLHWARLPARQDAGGGLLLLEEQDRSKWDPGQIQLGLSWLARSACGEELSRYHAEAGIAAEHCLAPSLKETRWDRVVECYALLEQHAPSALHTLGHAVALAEWRGPEAGLALLRDVAPPSWLAGSHLWSAVLADLHQRAGHANLADQHRAIALAAAPSDAVRALLRRRLSG